MHEFKPTHLAMAISISLFHLPTYATASPTVPEQASAELEIVEVIGHKISGAKSVQISDIQRKQAADLEDLLRDQANITVGGGFGAAQKVYVRGIEDTNLNVTIDGAAQSGQLFHHQARLSIEPELLKQVDIKAGAGTALDGFGALGGAIHFTTKDVEDLVDIGDSGGAIFKTGYLSNTKGKHISSSFYGYLNDSVSAMATLGMRKGDEFEDGAGRVIEHTNYEQEVGLIKVEANLTPQNRVKLSHDLRRDDGKRNLRVHFNHAPWNQATEQKSERSTTTLTFNHDDSNDVMDIMAKVYSTKNTFSFAELVRANHDSMQIKTLGWDVRNKSQLAYHVLTYGMEYRKNTTTHQATHASETDKAYALYLQDQVHISAKTTLSYGLRYDKYTYDDAFGERFTSDGMSPNANVEYAVTDTWTLRAGYSQALRGQTTKQAIMVGSVKNAEGLAEEQAKNIELSASYQQNGWYVNATIFRTDIDDVVTAQGNPLQGFSYQNSGKLESRGVDVTLAKNWQQARVALTYSQNTPEINGEPLNDSHFGLGTSYGDAVTLNASYQLQQVDAELGWSSRVVQDMDKVPAGYPEKQGFNSHDIYFEWYPQHYRHLSVNFTVHNVFDEHYFDHGTFGFDPDSQMLIGLPEAGRDARLTLTWQF